MMSDTSDTSDMKPAEMFDFLFAETNRDRNDRFGVRPVVYPDDASKIRIINAIANMRKEKRDMKYIIAATIAYLEGYTMGLEHASLK